MEQHPVPQNITGFQFKLIGNMTLRQFGYAAAGSIFGYIIFQLLPFPFSWLFGPLVFFLGASFAFLPLQERPLDRWIVCFFKSVFGPTQFIWQKNPPIPYFLETGFGAEAIKRAAPIQFNESRAKLDAYLKSLPPKPHENLDSFEKKYLDYILNLSLYSALTIKEPAEEKPKEAVSASAFFIPKITITDYQKVSKTFSKPRPMATSPKPKIPTPPSTSNEEVLRLKKEIEMLRRQTQAVTSPYANTKASQEYLADLEKRLEEAERRAESMTTEILRLHQELGQKPKIVVPKEILKEEEKRPSVKIVPPKMSKQVGMAGLPEIPNLITGIVQGSKGDLLPNILVEVKDSNGNPVRAFKTNSLGQFRAATPLPNGTYSLELEDPRNNFRFDIIEIKLEGKLVSPVVIYGQTQSEIEGKNTIEAIRAGLFGKQNGN